MKKIVYTIVAFLISMNAYSQKSTWLEDISTKVGLDSALGSRVFVVDLNGDDYPDLLFTGKTAIKNELYLYINMEDDSNKGKRKFVDFTKQSGINVPTYSGRTTRWSDAVGLADFDNDGDLDIMTAPYTHRITSFMDSTGIEKGHFSEVLLNDGKGVFTVKENSGLHDIVAFKGKIKAKIGNKDYTFDYPEYFLNATGIAFLDYDYDGNIDAYISTWFTNYTNGDANEIKMKDILLKGKGDGTFVQIIDPSIDKIMQPMYGVNITDYNNDGWQDIITSPYCRSAGSLFKNNKDGTFKDATAETKYSAQAIAGDHAQPLCQWEAIPADFDRDGDMDLLQVSVHGGYDAGEGRTTLAINSGEEFGYTYKWELERINRNVPPSTTHVGDMGGEFFDLDGDGNLEIVICQQGYEQAPTNVNGQTRTYVLFQDEQKHYIEKTEELGMMTSANRPHSFEPADFDLDGDQDMFLSRQHQDKNGVLNVFETLWENKIGNENFWTNIKIDAPDNCNKAAIGTRIYVYNSTGVQIGEIQSGLGHFGGIKPLMTNFGLGTEPAIDSIKIRLPRKDNQFITVVNPPANANIIIGEEGIKGFVFPDKKKHAVIAFDRTKADFDLMSFGKDSIINLKILNLGTEDLTISKMEISNNEKNVYTLIENYDNVTIKPNSTKEIKIKFSPTERTLFSSLLKIESNAFNNKAGILKIEGECFKAEPMISSLPDTLKSGIVLNEDLVELLSDIRNFGELPLKISKIDIRTDSPAMFEKLSFETDLKDSLLNSGEIQKIKILAITNVDIDKLIKAELIISSDAYNFPEFVVPIVINAKTRKAVVEFVTNEGRIDFPESEIGCNCEQDFIIKSIGTKPLEISKIEIKFNNDKIFAIKDYNPPYIIAQNTEYELPLIFSPKNDVNYSKQIKFTTNSFEQTEYQFTITGQGKKPDLVLDEMYFGVKLNIYPHPLENISNIAISLDNTLQSDLEISIFDLHGNYIEAIKSPSKLSGEYEIVWDSSKLIKGVYIMVLNIEGKQYQKMIVKN